MYKRASQGWMKHLDFIILDCLAAQAAFILAYAIRMGSWNPYGSWLYRNLAIVLFLCDFLVAVLFSTMHNVLKRGYLIELGQTLKQALLVFALGTVFLFSFQYGNQYSRIVLFLTSILHIGIGYGTRLLWKQVLMKRGLSSTQKESMLAVLSADRAEAVLERIMPHPVEGYSITGVVLDQPGIESVHGLPVVCGMSEAAQYICREWVDSVYIDCPMSDELVKLMEHCREMAVPVHYHIPGLTRDNAKQFVEKIGGTNVLTTTQNFATPAELIVKRVMDVLGGIFGSILALIIMAVVGPKIKKASPGPILYRSERIGQNGKHFKMIKIRSMYMYADARKASLMSENRNKDGMMFKLDWDPRIIGNEELPDGTRKTGIGEFIRKTSLDEFPQFFNVLKGEMSLVGTRPPTLDEWEKYAYHHRARLACKPGITGMWQVSGRSEITDFEEVVKLDTEYLNNWSLRLDIKILFRTVVSVLTHKGAM